MRFGRATYPVQRLPVVIPIGIQTETGVEEIAFDISAWLAKWPDVKVEVWHRLPGQTEAYLTKSRREGDIVYWEVSSTDTQTPGTGKVELMGILPDGRKLSGSTDTRIRETICASTQDPPDAPPTWVDTVREMIRSAQVTPESFGAVGDGVADDTEAVRRALLTGVCRLDNTYRVTGRIDVPNDCVLTGSGTLVVDSATFGIVFTGKRVTLENIKVVIAPNLLYYAFWIRECADVKISGVTITGRGIMPCGNGFDAIRCEECHTVHVSDTSIKDIGMYTDYKVSSDKGNVTGINFRFCKYVEVNNFLAANLHNFDDGGNYYLDDSDALFCAGKETVFHVVNSTFAEAGKRAIKTACDNILIDNCYIYTSTDDSFTGLGFNHVSDGSGAEYPVASALVSNCTIVNHHTSGYTYCLVAAAGNISVNHCRFVARHDLWGCCIADTNGASITYNNCVFDGDFFAGDSDQTFCDCIIRNVVWPGYGTGKITLHNTSCNNVEAGAVEARDSTFATIHCKDDSELTDCIFYGLAKFDNYAALKHCRSKTSDATSLILNGGALIDDFDAGEDSKYIGLGFSGDGEMLKFRAVDFARNLIDKPSASTQRIKTVPYFVESFPVKAYSHAGMIVQSMQDMRYYRYNGVAWSVIVPTTGESGDGTLDNSQLDSFVLS